MDTGNPPDTAKFLSDLAVRDTLVRVIAAVQPEASRLCCNGVTAEELARHYVIIHDEATGRSRLVTKEIAEAMVGV